MLKKMKVLDQVGPKVSNEIYDETFDMRPVNVLVGHNKNSSIAKTRQRLVLVLRVESYDFKNVLNFLIVDQFFMGNISDIK